ncbi:hypothetical protein V5O48_006860 [Marasmius crinis-equi]|uniref:Uncharacterized protein n=1 Tax=Marasmius crinis-equi TaxID=585013 RepID=A0ABR3FIA6_9AGAR
MATDIEPGELLPPLEIVLESGHNSDRDSDHNSDPDSDRDSEFSMEDESDSSMDSIHVNAEDNKENISNAATVDGEEELAEQSDQDTMAILLELAEAMRYLTRNHLARSQKVYIRLSLRDIIVRYEASGVPQEDVVNHTNPNAMEYVIKLAKCARYMSREQLMRNERVSMEFTNDFLHLTYDGRGRDGDEDNRVWMSEFIEGPPLPSGDLSRSRVRDFSAALTSAFWARVEREMTEQGWESERADVVRRGRDMGEVIDRGRGFERQALARRNRHGDPYHDDYHHRTQLNTKISKVMFSVTRAGQSTWPPHSQKAI